LIASWLAGAYSLARVLQLTVDALTRPAASRRREPSFSLTQAHSLHVIWLVGLGASIAVMGVLGLWSWADGWTSGLAPCCAVALRPRARRAAGPGRGATPGARRRCLPRDGTDVAVLRGPVTRLGRSGLWGRSGRPLRWVRAAAR